MVVDDEPLARRVLEKYIAAVPSLTLVKQCGDAIEAAAYLHAHSVDVIFLDIQMPELTGLEFLKTLPRQPQIILTTAYCEYALAGYEYSVVDYLLKPFSFERFLKAVNKTARLAAKQTHDQTAKSKTADGFVFLRTEKVDHRVKYSAIRYLEGYGNFVKVFTDQGMLLVSETMTKIEERLPKDMFLRVHKSYIVAVVRIDCIEGNIIRLKNDIIPIGRHYKQEVERVLSRFRI